nr:hypothetical protein [Ardenticatenales bacterium]
LYDAGEAGSLTEEQFYIGFGRAHGFNPPDTLTLDEEGRHAVRATLLEPRAWSVSIPWEQVAALPMPKLLFAGNWFPALQIVSETLAERMGAELVTLPGAGHYVQKTGEPFNERLVAHLQTDVAPFF